VELPCQASTSTTSSGRRTATQEIKTIKLDPKVVDPSDLGLLEDLLIAAVNAALSASKEHMQKELSKISGGVKIPGVT